MTYEIHAREAQIFGGLVVPHVKPGFKVSSSELVDFLKGRLRDRGDDRSEIYCVYVPDSAGESNLLVCFSHDNTDGIPVGDIFVRVPKAIYAVFKPNGEYVDPIEDVWAQVGAASDSGEIVRAFTEEIEICRESDDIELHISITL